MPEETTAMNDQQFLAAMELAMTDLQELVTEWERRGISAEETLKLKDAYESIFRIGVPLHQEIYDENGNLRKPS